MRLPKNIIALSAIIGITTIEITALLKGIDGQLLATTIAILAGIAGYSVKR